MAAEKKMTPVLIRYDWWDENGERQPAGQVVSMPIDAAKVLLADGKADRADPFPGEG